MMLSRHRIALWICATSLTAPRCPALVYCVTNAVDYHQAAPTGMLENSGWSQTVPIGDFLGTVIHSNALLTAEHLKFGVGRTFSHEGQSRTVTAVVTNDANDFAILFFTPAATNVALINIETNDITSVVCLQGRGMERGAEVIVDGRTNGWEWGSWRTIRRWGLNCYCGETNNGVYAVASFDNTGDPDECMLSPGDSGGPGFIRSGSGWKLATVNYAVDPDRFLFSTNSGSSFYASLFDCTGLYYFRYDNNSWQYVPTNAAPVPCLMINTRTSKSIAWITNTVAGITFPADIGVAWRCKTNWPSAGDAATGIWFEVVATNAGPYVARDVAIDLAWPGGVRLSGSSATHGTFVTNRWTLPALNDGGVATLRVDTVVWLSESGWGTNRASVTASDKPDGNSANNSAEGAVYLPATATRLMIE